MNIPFKALSDRLKNNSDECKNTKAYNNNIVSLSGGSILPKSNSYQTLFAVSADCNANPNYESGIIKKTKEKELEK